MASWLSGVTGDIVINNIDLGGGVTGSLDIGSDDSILWSSTTEPSGAKDTGVKRGSAGVLKITDGSSGTGGLTVGAVGCGAITPSADNTSALGAAGYRFTNAFAVSFYATNVYSYTGAALGVSSVAPSAAAASQAGVAVNVTSSAATAGTSSDGAAAGGDVVITSGAAARRNSGNANGGDIRFSPGAGIGTGVIGRVQVASDTAQLTFGASSDVGLTRYAASVVKITDGSTGFGSPTALSYFFSPSGEVRDTSYLIDFNPVSGIALSTGLPITFTGTSTYYTSPDVGLVRPSAGLLKITGGGSNLGSLNASNLTLTTLPHPATPVITQGGAGGATAYGYKIVAKLNDGTTTLVGTEGTTATGNATLDGTNYNIITWSATTGAVSYDVYRSTGGAAQGKILTGVTSPQNDTGLTASGSEPSLQGTGKLTFTDDASGGSYIKNWHVSTQRGLTINLDTAGGGEEYLVITKGTSETMMGYIGGSGFTSSSTTGGFQAGSSAELGVSSGVAYMRLRDNGLIKWSSTTEAFGTPDIGLARNAAGVLEVTDGSTGDGNIVASTGITDVTGASPSASVAALYNGVIRTGVFKKKWVLADVTAFSADDGSIKICTLPANTIIRSAVLIVDLAETHLSDFTIHVGWTGADYADIFDNVNGQSQAQTTWNNDAATLKIPHNDGTQDIYIHFATTDGSHTLADALMSQGYVYLLTETLP